MKGLIASALGRYKIIGDLSSQDRRQEIPEVERHLSAVGLTLEHFANDPQNPLPVRLNPQDANYHDQYFTGTHVDLAYEKPYKFEGVFHQRPLTPEKIGDLTVHAPEQKHRFSYRLDR
jgi:hypothetical protein